MKLKKFIAPLMAASFVASAMPLIDVSAASDPRVYVDLTYEDGNDNVRADIMFENMPNVRSGGFHIEVGDGWNLVMKGTSQAKTSDTGCTAGEEQISTTSRTYGDNDFFITFSGETSGHDLNGRFLSFYLVKNENFNSNNSEVNVVFKTVNSNAYDYIRGKNEYVITSETDHSPAMLEAREYIVGDVNNDGYVNAMDASDVLSAVKSNNNKPLIVKDIERTYKSMFPDAVCPASPDASQDGMISRLDVDVILDYYMDMSTDGVNNSRVGKLDFYEFFNN